MKYNNQDEFGMNDSMYILYVYIYIYAGKIVYPVSQKKDCTRSNKAKQTIERRGGGICRPSIGWSHSHKEVVRQWKGC